MSIDWTKVKDSPPKKAGKYLCAVATPDGYGRATVDFQTLYFYGRMGMWKLENGIVTHWAMLPMEDTYNG